MSLNLDPAEMNCTHAASRVYAQARAERTEAALVSFRRAILDLSTELKKQGHDAMICCACVGDTLRRILATDGE